MFKGPPFHWDWRASSPDLALGPPNTLEVEGDTDNLSSDPDSQQSEQVRERVLPWHYCNVYSFLETLAHPNTNDMY